MSKGFNSLEIGGSVGASAFNFKVLAKTISATEIIDSRSVFWQNLSAASAQDIVLPDATTLPNGWSRVFKSSGASTLNVKTYHATTPVLLQAILASAVWQFVLTDNATSAGVWERVLLPNTAQQAAARYTEEFNDTTDWGSPLGGFYTRTILAATHQMGQYPDAKAWYNNGLSYEAGTLSDILLDKATGNITLRVSDIPDNRFAGLLMVQ